MAEFEVTGTRRRSIDERYDEDPLRTRLARCDPCFPIEVLEIRGQGPGWVLTRLSHAGSRAALEYHSTQSGPIASFLFAKLGETGVMERRAYWAERPSSEADEAKHDPGLRSHPRHGGSWQRGGGPAVDTGVWAQEDSICTSRCPAIRQQKSLSSSRFGVLKAGLPTRLLLRRSVCFHRHMQNTRPSNLLSHTL